MNSLEGKVKDRKFYSLIKKLTNSFGDALDKPFVEEYGSWYDRIKILAKGDTDIIAKILLKRPDLSNQKLSQCLVDIKKTTDYFDVQKEFSKKPPHASTKEEFTEELILFLVRMMHEKNHVHNEKMFSRQGEIRHFERILVTDYLKYEKYLYDTSVSNFIICPFENFDSDSTMDFSESLMIKRITQDEFHHLEKLQSEDGNVLKSYPEYAIVLTNTHDWMQKVISIVTACRLLKKGAIGIKTVFFGYAFPFRSWDVLSVPSEIKFYKKEKEPLFSVVKSEKKELVELFLKIKGALFADFLEIASRRFNLAYQRDKIEDRFIDYFVSLESLYSTKVERGEVTHRISTRASKVLDKSLENRRTKRNRLKKLYNYRSGIVHGEKIKLTWENIEEVENIVRQSLKWFINRKTGTDHHKIIDELDFML